MRNKFYIILNSLNIISIVFCIFNLFNQYEERVLFPTLIILVFEIFMIMKKESIINLQIKKESILLSIILCCLFFTMLPISSCLNSFHFLNNFFLKTIFIISLFFSLMVIFLLLFLYQCTNTNDIKKFRYIIMFLILFISIIFIGSTSTGFYDTDFPDVWQSGKHGWSNWHTFALAFLVYFCRITFNNPYFIIIINFLLYIYFCNYALKIIGRETKCKKLMLLFFFINIFTIVGFDQLRYITKDLLFSLGFCNLILTIIDYLTLNKLTTKIIVNLIVFSIVTIVFRHGALYLMIFIFLVLTVYLIIKKGYFNFIFLAIVMIMTFGSYFIIQYIGFTILKGYDYPQNVVYTVPIYQVGAFVNAEYKFNEDEKNYLEKYLPIEYMANNFQKYSGDALARISDPLYNQNVYTFNYEGLIKINYNLFKNNPIFYIKSLLDLTNILWKIEIDENEWYSYFYKNNWEYNSSLKNSTIDQKATVLNNIVDPIVDLGLKKFLFNIRARGAFPMFIIILSAFLLIYKRKYILLIPILFILFWYICLFLSLPMGFVRYCLPFINIYPVIFCISLGLKLE